MSQWHTAFHVDDHFFRHGTIAMEAKNLFLATVIWTPASTTTAAIIAAASHGNDADFIADFKAVRIGIFSVGTECDNSPAAFVADRSRPLHPVEIWLGETGAVVRATDANEKGLNENFTDARIRQFDRLDGEIGGQIFRAWLNRVAAVQPQGVDGLAHRVARL